MEDNSIINEIFDKFKKDIAKDSNIGDSLSNEILEIIKKDKLKKDEIELKIKEGAKNENS
jgi:hypothetical protein